MMTNTRTFKEIALFALLHDHELSNLKQACQAQMCKEGDYIR